MKQYATISPLKFMELITKYSEREISKLRMEKLLYFVYAYYGGYVKKSRNPLIKEELFPAMFKVNKWGFSIDIDGLWDKVVLLRDVDSLVIPLNTSEQIANNILKDLIRETDQYGDFHLVEINHVDKEWQRCYYENKDMDKERLFEEYSLKII